jgi:hypothetical protein
MTSPKKSDWEFVPKSKATRMPDKGEFFQVYRNWWWVVTDNDEIIFYCKYGLSPQCNPNESIARSIQEKEWHPGTHVEQLEVVFVPHDCHDYI